MARSTTFNYAPYGSIPAGIETVSLSDSLSYKGVKGFVCNVDGTLAVTMEDGSSGTFVVLAGVMYPGAVTIVKSTGSSGVTSVALFY